MAMKQTVLHLRASRAAQRRVKKLIGASSAYAFKGAGHPDSWDEIEEDYENARDGLLQFIAKLEQRVNR